ALDQPFAERRRDERERHGDTDAAREVAEGRVRASAELVVIAQAQAYRKRNGDGHRIRGLGEEGVARGDADLCVDALLAAGIDLAVKLEGDEDARVQSEWSKELRVVVRPPQRQFLNRGERVVGTGVGGVERIRREVLPEHSGEADVAIEFVPYLGVRGG